MSQQSSNAPAGTRDRWADPVVRRRGIFNIMTSSAVIFAVPGVAAGSVTATVLRRTQPAGLRQPPPRTARGVAVGAAAGGFTGALFGAALGAVFAIFDTAIRRYLKVQRPPGRPSDTKEPIVTDTKVSDTDSGQT